MKIKMTISMAGADFALSPGDETERFPADEARNLIELGYAVPVVTEKRETATKKTPAKETR